MLLFLLLLPLTVFSKERPRFQCPKEFQYNKCWDRELFREIRTIENLKFLRDKLVAECRMNHNCLRPLNVNVYIGPLSNYTRKYEPHGEAILEECWKYAVGPYSDRPVGYLIKDECPQLVDGLHFNFNESTAEIVRTMRKRLKMIPENLKAPARLLHNFISEYYVFKNECGLSRINQLFLDNENPLYFMGVCFCEPGRVRVSAYNNSIVEHFKDSSLFHTLRGLNTTDHFLLEDDWDISFSKDNVTVTVPWRFRHRNNIIDCDFKVTYRLIDFFEENPKLRNVVRLLCPYGRFELEPVCDLFSKIPNWAAPFIWEITEEEAKKALQEYEERKRDIEEIKKWPLSRSESFSYYAWKTFELPRVYSYK